MTLVGVLRFGLVNLWLFVLLPVFGMVLFIIVAFVTPRYVAQSRFLPDASQGNRGGVVSLAARFGLNLGDQGSGQSIEFYAGLLKSRELLEAVLTEKYLVAGAADTTALASLLEIWKSDGPTEAARRLGAVGRLRSQISLTMDRPAGIITLTTTAQTEGLAEQINSHLLESLNQFNLSRRQSRASLERAFAERRAQEAYQDLELAERNLQEFQESNRNLGSPRLIMEVGRLQRQVTLAQEVYVALVQNMEQARLDEVRDTPVITIIEHAEGSEKYERRTAILGIIGLILGGFLALAVAILRQYSQNLRATSPEQLDELWDLLSRVRPGARRKRASG